MDETPDSTHPSSQALVSIDAIDPERLGHINRLTEMGVLSASLLHELRQPLVVIKSYAEMILVEGGPKDPRLVGIHNAALSMSTLISDFVNFSRSDGPVREALDINRPIEEALSMMSFRVKRTRTQLTRALSDGLPKIWAGSMGIRQIVANLILNSIDALEDMPNKRVWVISQETLSGEVEVLIGDNGAGVAPEDEEVIFELFFTSKEEGKGTGLGLAISKDIAERHGGQLELLTDPALVQDALPDELSAEGEPLPVTLFRLRLPVAEI